MTRWVIDEKSGLSITHQCHRLPDSWSTCRLSIDNWSKLSDSLFLFNMLPKCYECSLFWYHKRLSCNNWKTDLIKKNKKQTAVMMYWTHFLIQTWRFVIYSTDIFWSCHVTIQRTFRNIGTCLFSFFVLIAWFKYPFLASRTKGCFSLVSTSSKFIRSFFTRKF